MTREEAQHILELCRPGNEADLHDPLIAQALELMENDPELSDWFEAQQAADAHICEQFEQIEVPADLEATILAGMRAHAEAAGAHSETEAEQSDEAPIPFPSATATEDRSKQAWWLNPWTGIAALFAIMMVFLTVPNSEEQPELVAGIPPVLQFLSKEIDSLRPWNFDKRSDQAQELQTYLASYNAPAPQNIPNCLEKMPTIGCVTFDYDSTQMSMICFKDEATYHLVTIDKADYPDSLPNEPQIYELSDKAFRVWVEGEQVKIITVHGDKEDIPEFI